MWYLSGTVRAGSFKSGEAETARHEQCMGETVMEKGEEQ
jgi:hypothetical protein